MGRRLSLTAVVILLAASFWGGPIAAKADDPAPDDLTTLLAEESLSEPGAQELVDSYGGSVPTSTYDDCPQQASPPPTYPGVAYKSFKNSPGSASIPIYLDEFDPPQPWNPAGYPVMVLVHGGGWWRGCRWQLDLVALEASGITPPVPPLSGYFIVLNIDYRLACDPNDPNLQNSPIRVLCGWNYTRTELGTGTQGAATHDVQDAVRWVTNTWQFLPGRPTWNQSKGVVLLGTSAGGTLVSSAVAPSTNVGGAVSVHAVASWSGFLEFDRMDQPDGNIYHWPCEQGQSRFPGDCAQSHSLYLGCALNPYPDPVCKQPPPPPWGRYTDASPITWYLDPATLPPVFFGNGGGPYIGPGPNPVPETVPIQSAVDFRNSLNAHGWSPTKYSLCIVDDQDHARKLRGHPCDDDLSHTLWWRTAEFLYRSF